MNVVVRIAKCLVFCFLVGSFPLPFQTAVATQTNLPVRIMAANLNGGTQSYQPFAIRIFQGLKPDVVAIQEFKYNNNTPEDFRSMLDTAFGTNFVYFREDYTASGDLPNGIISRWPILGGGSWVDPVVSNRGFAWAQIDLPGTNHLYVVSVHLYSGGTATDRNTEATAIKNQIMANFPSNAWVVVGGDFNTDTRSEAAVTTFKTFLSDNPIPTDQAGNQNTSAPRSKPYDYLLPSFSFTNSLVAVAISNQSFANGLVFDSRVYTPLTDVAPVQSSDSGNAQHMAVLKDFTITYTLTNTSDAPAITTQPESQTVEPGSSATFTVIATGAATLQYQWRFGGTNLASATASTLTVTNAQSGDAGTYAVVITNSAGSITSSPAILTVGTLPVITAQPQSQSVNTGATVTFSVTATGTSPLAYQWRCNGTNLAGATTSSCVLTNVQSQDAGSYSVLVTNLVGSATSSNATLTINAPPAITAQPQSQTVAPGQDATFTVGATGATPLSYQWRFNGTNLAGATASTYTRASAQTNDAGSYSVVITNTVGSITSSNAVLTVTVVSNAVIAQWNFNSSPADTDVTTGTIAPSLGAGTASLIGGTLQVFATGSSTDPATTDNSGWNTTNYPAVGANNKTAGVRFVVSTAGRQSISIRWDQRVSSTGSKYARLRYTTNGTTFVDFPTVIIEAAGATFEPKTNSLAGLPGVDNNPLFAFQIVTEFQSTATTNGSDAYVAVGGGNYASSGTIRFDMVTISGTAIPAATAPAVTSQPANQIVNQGADATFSVLSSGTAPLGYQWHFNAATIAGATASTYTRSNVQPADMGSYSVVVSNSAGTAASSNAMLSLVVPRPTLVMQSPQVIQWQGLSNLTYTVQAKTNIEETNWFTVGTASAPGASVSFTNQADAPQRFYRVVYLN